MGAWLRVPRTGGDLRRDGLGLPQGLFSGRTCFAYAFNNPRPSHCRRGRTACLGTWWMTKLNHDMTWEFPVTRSSSDDGLRNQPETSNRRYTYVRGRVGRGNPTRVILYQLGALPNFRAGRGDLGTHVSEPGWSISYVPTAGCGYSIN